MKKTTQVMYMTVYIHVSKKMKKKLYFEILSISYEDWLKGAEGSKDDWTLELIVDLVKG
jgi:hypothetical protein